MLKYQLMLRMLNMNHNFHSTKWLNVNLALEKESFVLGFSKIKVLSGEINLDLNS